jgi:predicted molibdopterin-dependent oxidoreductase YjgC
VTDRIERRHVFTTFQFPGPRANLLIVQSADVNTWCPEYDVVAVDVRPIGEQSTMTPALAGAAGS